MPQSKFILEKDTSKVAKPCPFCGIVPNVDDSLTFATNQGTKWGFLQCSCGAQGPEVRTNYQVVEYWKDDALGAWNERIN